jgi:VWFA-related protein
MSRRPQRPGALRKCCSLVLGLAWVACGQSPIPVFRVSTELIQVDAVVTDAKGVHVKGLTTADFQVEQDGRPQRVVSCSHVSAPTEDRTAASPIPSATQERPRRDGRRMVVLIDNTDLSAESLSATRAALLALIEKRLQPDDAVALVVASQAPGYFQEFTANKALLRGAVGRIPWRFTPGRSTGPLQPTVNKALDMKFPAMLAQQHLYDQLAVQYRSLGTLNSVLVNMGRLPGRKALTIVSDGYAFHWNSRLSGDLANRAGVVVYHIDPRGMLATALSAMDRTDIFGMPLDPAQVAGLVDNRAGDLRMSELSIGEFPRQTGGYAVTHNNDISRVLAKVFDDSGDYYLLTYKPDAGSLENAESSYHRLTVKAKDADLLVRSRRGFYAPAAAAPGTAFDPIRLEVTPVLKRGEAGSPLFGVNDLHRFWRHSICGQQ